MSTLKKNMELFFYNKFIPFIKADKFKLVSIIIFSLLFSLYLFGENLHSKWWMIDDHEIMMFLGEDGKLSLAEIPKLLIEKTEVGDYGNYERYRPSYYTLRLIETAIWGNYPMLWYLFRILILTSFLSIILYLIWKNFNYVTGLFIVILVLSASYWAELMSRLGPGETYTVLGLGIFLLGLYQQFVYLISSQKKKPKHLWISQLLMCLGCVISVGSKENFVILLAPMFLLILVALIRKKLDFGLLISSIIGLLYTCFIMSSVILGMSKSGMDVYDNDINLRSLLSLTYHKIPDALEELYLFEFTIFVIAAFLVLFCIKNKNVLKKYLSNVLIFYFGMFILVCLYLSQFFFYSGAWPTGMRYDFPGLLYIPCLVLLAIFLFRETMKCFGINKIFVNQMLTVFFILVVVKVSPMHYYDYLREYTLQNVERTTAFTDTINEIVNVAKDDESADIFFETYSVWDHEPIGSVHRFLIANGVKNNIYINTNKYVASTSLEKELQRQIELVSENGGIFANTEVFTEHENEIEKRDGCITLFFSGSDEDDICKQFKIR